MPRAADLAARDVVSVSLGDGRLLIQAVDVAVGIGQAPDDTLSSPPSEVGYYVARTAAAELWSLGVEPVVAAVTVGHRSSAEFVLRGVQEALLEMGQTVPVVRSTENYVESRVSSVSVAVSGVVAEDSLVLGRPSAGDHIQLLGGGYSPRHADTNPGRWPLHALTRVLEQRDRLVQVIPVGSGGVGRDLADLRECYGLALLGSPAAADLNRPGGPGLLFLVIAREPITGPRVTAFGQLTPSD